MAEINKERQSSRNEKHKRISSHTSVEETLMADKQKVITEIWVKMKNKILHPLNGQNEIC